MLIEIKSKAFKQNVIKFHKGLNIVLGDEKASNSIGKSTMLKVIDFAFGGESYSKDNDVIKNVGHHDINFTFEFSNIKYVFSRSTQTPKKLKVLFSESVVEEQTWSIEKFRKFLLDQYFSNEFHLTFRSYVQLFCRIYGYKNLDELHPLHLFGSEKGVDINMKLIKMFNRYDKIEAQQKIYNEFKEKLDVLTKAVKAEFVVISKNVREYNTIDKKINDLQANIDSVKTQLETTTLDLSVEQYQIVENFKFSLSKIQTKKQRLTSEIKKLSIQENSNKTFLQKDKEQLQKLFPSINIKAIDDINRFHTQLSSILKKEIQKHIKEKENGIKLLEIREKEEIESIKKALAVKNPQNIAIDRLIDFQRQIDKLLSEKGCYEQKKAMAEDTRTAEKLLNEMLENNLIAIQQNINNKIDEENNSFLNAEKHSPLLNLKPKNYTYSSEDDQGTGTQYKNLILLDLALLSLTQLPFLIHDSVLFKNIEYETMDKIIKLYGTYTDKQIFIATDSINDYNPIIQEYINKNAVIRLSHNRCELYGKSWSSKKQNSNK